MNPHSPNLRIIDLGRMGYTQAYDIQQRHHAELLEARNAGTPEPGRLLLVEHDPVITVTKRKGAADHLLASHAMLEQMGVTLHPTDRGGDITYHGPGQIVAYPILDLNTLGLNLHAHMRLLEQAVIDTIAAFGLTGLRDEGVTGVWLPGPDGSPQRKIVAMGVRVRRWITLHGLALNVRTSLDHFRLIVPCGLAGRPVTSMQRELGELCPATEVVRAELVRVFQRLVHEAQSAQSGRPRAPSEPRA